MVFGLIPNSLFIPVGTNAEKVKPTLEKELLPGVYDGVLIQTETDSNITADGNHKPVVFDSSVKKDRRALSENALDL